MRVLFTSDLHSLPTAYLRFSTLLKNLDIGIIAGDLLDEYMSEEEIVRMLNLDPDILLPELPSPDETADEMVKRWRESEQAEHMMQGLAAKEREIKAILQSAGKPVLVVPGNHDRTALADDGFFRNIHLRRLDLNGLNFVGYGWIGSDLNPERQMDGFQEVEPLIDRNTILVTHSPPFKVLDKVHGQKYGIGSKALAEAVKRTRPRFHLFGHSHANAGFKGTSVNGSYPNVSHFFGIDTTRRRVWVEK